MSTCTTAGSGRRAVLLVEDERVLLGVLAHILTVAGYDVTSCHDGREALELAKREADRFDVVLSDVGLPGLRGDTLATALRHLRPDLPVLLMTGFSTIVTPSNAAELGVAAVLEKPIEIEVLLEAIRDALRPVVPVTDG